MTPYKLDNSVANILGNSITKCYENNNDNYFQGGFTITDIPINKALDINFYPENEPFSAYEAASAFRLPSPPLEDLPGLPIKRFRTSMIMNPIKCSNPSNKIDLFVNVHKGINQTISMESEDRMRHTFILGQTGTGKSTLMEHMILQDIHAGKGVAVIDPHGEMVETLLNRVPKERAEDIIYFNLLDRERPIGFNLIQWNTIDERDLIIDDLYVTLDKIYDMMKTGGPIFESYFRGILKLLMGDQHRENFTPTLLEFSLCFINREFRKWLKDSLKDPTILDFIQEIEKAGGDASLNNVSPYITSKLSRFINDTTLKRIVGQETTSFSFDDIMNKSKILLMNLGKGRFGATVSALIANQIVTRFKISAMKRGEIPPENRQDFYLYVDECHNLPSDNFMELLSEARKFRLGLILATQYTAQLGANSNGENKLLSAIFGNVGTIVSFRLGNEDAARVSSIFEPYFSATDITGLPNWNGYARLQVNNEPTAAFSFKTQISQIPSRKDLAEKYKILSRLKYGQDANIVDAEINRRRNTWQNKS